jgi:hypothetical protein
MKCKDTAKKIAICENFEELSQLPPMLFSYDYNTKIFTKYIIANGPCH